ncbi:hypothetical protein T484DRAFT_3452254 [Baffinella frigidus]|nr:hypothetical protein T484DRAFT_3452254 [Cryptophyta sp. CCMP2293]
MLTTSSKFSRPQNPDALQRLFQETQGCLEKLVEMEDDLGPLQSHHKLVSNGLGALSWVSVEFPVTFISETLGSINVFGTKVIHTVDLEPFIKSQLALMRLT